MTRPHISYVNSLNDQVWESFILESAIANGVFDLSEPRTAKQIASNSGIPEQLANAILLLGVNAGLIETTGNSFRICLNVDKEIHYLKARLRTTQIQAQNFTASFTQTKPDFAWNSGNSELIELQGALSSDSMVEMFDENVRPFLGELGDVLDKRVCHFLDVGAGVGSLTFAMAKRWSKLHSVGIEPARTPYEFATGQLAKSNFSERIEFVNQGVEEIVFESRFDLAWFPHVFIPSNKVNDGFRTVARALKPGGRILILYHPGLLTNRSEAIRCVQTFAYGGAPALLSDLIQALSHHNFTDIQVIPNRPEGQFCFLIARTPENDGRQ